MGGDEIPREMDEEPGCSDEGDDVGTRSALVYWLK
jgi:hypothetical protein